MFAKKRSSWCHCGLSKNWREHQKYFFGDFTVNLCFFCAVQLLFKIIANVWWLMMVVTMIMVMMTIIIRWYIIIIIINIYNMIIIIVERIILLWISVYGCSTLYCIIVCIIVLILSHMVLYLHCINKPAWSRDSIVFALYS